MRWISFAVYLSSRPLVLIVIGFLRVSSPAPGHPGQHLTSPVTDLLVCDRPRLGGLPPSAWSRFIRAHLSLSFTSPRRSSALSSSLSGGGKYLGVCTAGASTYPGLHSTQISTMRLLRAERRCEVGSLRAPRESVLLSWYRYVSQYCLIEVEAPAGLTVGRFRSLGFGRFGCTTARYGRLSSFRLTLCRRPNYARFSLVTGRSSYPSRTWLRRKRDSHCTPRIGFPLISTDHRLIMSARYPPPTLT